ncbi:complex III assembly factor LYRM7 [Zerene cesonia]|uniref:complex III assembly factor LYRM7 n=1 Tax=Zerene cesonia TaxID=33412 RepID=UPI0018E5A8DF|nr:complex III assembly factor LYRM7 [Zerene cesonia]
MMDNLRRAVLQNFKKLHRTRLKVFAGDYRALNAARLKINEEYKKNKAVQDSDAIQAMIKYSEEVEQELRTQVIQAREVKPGVFEARITEDTVKLDNVPFDENADIPKKSRRNQPCCQDQESKKQ